MSAFKCGVALPYLGARGIAVLARQAEQAGWDGVYVGDAIWCEDPMIGLAAAATQTSRIRLGTMVIPVPLRRPWKLPSETVALDHLSARRRREQFSALWNSGRKFDVSTTPQSPRRFTLRLQ